MFDELDVYHDAERRSAPLNMAIDESLLENAARPALRLYGWKRLSLSFGYFGKYDEAAKAAGGRDLVRRWTGGGVVFHGNDLTYALIIPAFDHRFTFASGAIYTAVHQAIRDVLRDEGKDALLATSAQPKISEACFRNAVVADVLLGGSKVAGAAQRRTRAGLLQQGSIQIDQLSPNFAERFARALCPLFRVRRLSSNTTRQASIIVEHKYGTELWLRRR